MIDADYPQAPDSRPVCWWFHRRRFWKRGWRLEDIPAESRASFDRWLAKVKAGEIKGLKADEY